MKKLLNRTFFSGAALALGLLGCQNDPNAAGKSVEEIKTDGKISTIIRSPISADGTVDSVNVAKMDFEETVFDFGEVDAGAVIKHEFKFVNNGKIPLTIQNAHSTCGCTIPDWPKEVIAPGEGGVIKVEFDTKGKSEFQEKPVIITANTYPSVTKVFVKGIVHGDVKK
jgi:Protein of unknown function (DUF1573)